MKTAPILALAAAAFASAAFAADRLEAEGATSAYYMLKPHAAALRESRGVDLVVAPVGTGRAMLDLIDGRTRAAVVTSPLPDAVEAARMLAWSEEGRALQVKGDLVYTTLPALDPTGRMLAVVTVGAPPPQLARAVDYLATAYRPRPTALAQEKR
jgi:hypothetical protein